MNYALLTGHVEALCRDHRVELDLRASTAARSWRRPRRIRVQPVKSLVTYYVALHELGHVLARRRSLGGRLEKEATAWMWALEHALEDPNAAVWGAVHRSLDSYLTWASNRQHRKKGRPVLPVEGDLFSRLHRCAGLSVIGHPYDAASADPTTTQESAVPEIVVQSPKWRARYVHPDKPHLEVRVQSPTKPAKRKLFNVHGEPVLLTAQDIQRITDSSTTTTTRSTPKMATRTRPKRKTKPAEAEPDDLDGLDVDDLDGLDELDVDDLGDLDLDDDLVDDEEEPEAEEDEDESDEDEEPEEDEDDDLDVDDLDEDDEDEPEEEAPKARKRSRRAPEPEDDDLDDLDDEGDEQPEPAPRRKKAAAKPKPSNNGGGERPLSDAQQRMLKDAYRLKAGAPVDNIGKQRTADALVTRKLVKFVPNTDKGYVEATVAGAKVLGKPKREPAVAKAAKPASKPAPKKSGTTAKKGNGAPRALPKGMYGVAAIAKTTKVHEETVRRVLRLNEDRFTQTDGRWAFTKDEAREVIREVKSYLKYTGGKRGRPSGATTALPDGKVGPSYIAEQAGVHKNTVYNFLRRHADRLKRFKNEDGMYLFSQAQADKIAAKVSK